MYEQIEVAAEWTSIATLLAFSDRLEARFALTAPQRYLLRLVIEEIATNIIKYGYDEHHRDVIQLRCACEGAVLRVTIRDRGHPYDPREHPTPTFDDNAETRTAGGLGLFFVRELADEVIYHRNEATGWNELTVLKGPTP